MLICVVKLLLCLRSIILIITIVTLSVAAFTAACNLLVILLALALLFAFVNHK